MKRYVAELVELACAFLCALVNHTGGCWLTSDSWLRYPYNWAIDTQYPMGTGAKCVCGEPMPCYCIEPENVTTSASGVTFMMRWPDRGTPCS